MSASGWIYMSPLLIGLNCTIVKNRGIILVKQEGGLILPRGSVWTAWPLLVDFAPKKSL